MGRDSLERDELHPVEWVGGVVPLGVAQGHQQPVRHKLDVLQEADMWWSVSTSYYIEWSVSATRALRVKAAAQVCDSQHVSRA